MLLFLFFVINFFQFAHTGNHDQTQIYLIKVAKSKKLKRIHKSFVSKKNIN